MRRKILQQLSLSFCQYCDQHLQLEEEGCDQLIRLAAGQLAQLSLLVDLLLPGPGDGVALLEDGQHHNILGVRESTLHQPGGGGELFV